MSNYGLVVMRCLGLVMVSVSAACLVGPLSAEGAGYVTSARIEHYLYAYSAAFGEKSTIGEIIAHHGFQYHKPLKAFTPGTETVEWYLPSDDTTVLARASTHFGSTTVKKPLRFKLTSDGRAALMKAKKTLRLVAHAQFVPTNPEDVIGTVSIIQHTRIFNVCRSSEGCDVNAGATAPSGGKG